MLALFIYLFLQFSVAFHCYKKAIFFHQKKEKKKKKAIFVCFGPFIFSYQLYYFTHDLSNI
jgi:thiamine transporter ThiT